MGAMNKPNGECIQRYIYINEYSKGHCSNWFTKHVRLQFYLFIFVMFLVNPCRAYWAVHPEQSNKEAINMYCCTIPGKILSENPWPCTNRPKNLWLWASDAIIKNQRVHYRRPWPKAILFFGLGEENKYLPPSGIEPRTSRITSRHLNQRTS